MADFRFLATLCIVLGLLLFVPAASATHVKCGDVISQDATLDSDLTCTGDGLTVSAPNVTVDLAGHTIAGVSSAVGIGSSYVIHGLTIRGGTIRDFGSGVDVDGPRGTVVRDMLLERNGIGVRCNYAPECTVTSSEVRRNQIGIRFAAVDAGCESGSNVVGNYVHHNAVGVRYAGCNGTISDNRIDRNTGVGVDIEDHGRVVVSSNTIVRSGDAGVYAEYMADVHVLANRITLNTGHGVHLDGGTGPYGPGGAVRGNRVARNGEDGVRATNVWTVLVQGNATDRNGDDGIDVDINEYGGPVTVRANRAFFNFDLGIEADPGTVDGGGNKARHNGNPAQCVGIVCK